MKYYITIPLILVIAIAVVYNVKNKSARAYHDEYNHKVISVTDGDTITVTPGVDGEHHIRYLGIDTPEYNEPFGRQAANFNKSLVSSKKIKIRTIFQKLGFYMRILGLIYVKDEGTKEIQELFVNERILREGLAWIYPSEVLETKLKDTLIEAQSDAIQNKKNIWGKLKLDMKVYEEVKRPIFHTSTTCNKQPKKDTSLKAIDAFQKILLPCKRCREQLWK